MLKKKWGKMYIIYMWMKCWWHDDVVLGEDCIVTLEWNSMPYKYQFYKCTCILSEIWWQIHVKKNKINYFNFNNQGACEQFFIKKKISILNVLSVDISVIIVTEQSDKQEVSAVTIINCRKLLINFHWTDEVNVNGSYSIIKHYIFTTYFICVILYVCLVRHV